VDLPGYGFAKTVKKSAPDPFQEMIAGYLEGRENLACVFVLIDSRHPPQRIDLEFVQWLMKGRAPFVLVFTKADVAKPTQLKTNIALFQDEMAAWREELPRVFTTSSKTRSGRAELLAFIENALV
jgi:GTP-binding protein